MLLAGFGVTFRRRASSLATGEIQQTTNGILDT